MNLQILIMAVVSKTDMSKIPKYFKFVKKMNLNVCHVGCFVMVWPIIKLSSTIKLSDIY